MPFWALIAAVAVNTLAEQISKKVTVKPQWLKLFLMLFVMVFIAWPDKDLLFLSPYQFQALKYGGGNPFSESPVVARRVAELTAANDYVYVAGSEPQILYYARRQSPTRFVIAYPLMLNTPLALPYQEEIVADLNKRPPEVVVLSSSNLSWLMNNNSPKLFVSYLNNLLMSKYKLVGGFVNEGNSGHWEEPLDNARLPFCSLLLFKKRL
jgi:hypothetical protein